MKRYKQFTLLWLVNVVLLYLAEMLLPTQFTLGNNLFTPMLAALFTGFVWNVVLWNAEGMFKDLEMQSKNMMVMMGEYLGLNFVTLWLLARFAVLTGFGVSSYVYVFGLAFVANFVQYQTWVLTSKKK